MIFVLIVGEYESARNEIATKSLDQVINFIQTKMPDLMSNKGIVELWVDGKLIEEYYFSLESINCDTLKEDIIEYFEWEPVDKMSMEEYKRHQYLMEGLKEGFKE